MGAGSVKRYDERPYFARSLFAVDQQAGIAPRGAALDQETILLHA